MPSDLMQQRHAAYQTPKEILFATVKAATGQDAVGVEPIVQGYDNEVYQVSTTADIAYIVRIQQHGGTSFHTEAWAMNRCRAVGVSVPEIALITSIRVDDQDKAVMVQQRLPGQAVREIMAQLSPSEAAHVWAQAGAVLQRIHSIAVDGYGFAADTPGQWAWSTWTAWFAAARAQLVAHSPSLRRWGLTAIDLHTLDTMLDIYESEFPCEHPVLCHGDFIPKHLFVDAALRVTGIIDFGDIRGGPPIHDLAYLHMWRPEVDLSWVRAGYGPAAMLDDRFAHRLVLHSVGVQLQYLDYFLRQGSRAAAKPFTARLQNSLEQWWIVRQA
jgi:aminoglycoside phosphotransferase (APT) family kinase protein